MPYDQLNAIQSKYKKATEFVWVQEEPENMGAWPYISRKFRKSSFNFELVSRTESSSTATGYAKQHIAQQLYIVASAFESATGKKDKKQVEAATKKVVNID
jgi:2-oxoglutarate dehydrogenase E1 component